MKLVAFIFTCLFAGTALGQEPTSTDEAPYRVTSKEKHDMRVINSGTASLYQRIDMIRRAKKSIDLETYIFKPDKSGKMIMKELVAAAARGVKVRVLVDKSPMDWKLHEHIAKEMKDRGIEVRYYNTSSIFSPSSVQFRNHRKLLVRDGEEIITGGRNVADEYFDLSHRFNFLDRDVSIEGPIVKDMDQTFENFWNSRLVEKPEQVLPWEHKHPSDAEKDPGYEQRKWEYERKSKEAKALFETDPELDLILAQVEKQGKESLEEHEKRVCPEVAFASDREGAKFKESLNPDEYSNKYRLLRKEIMKWIETKAKDEFVLDTPYFLSSDITNKLRELLNQRQMKVKLFTNSLASTDAIPVSTVFNNTVTEFTPFEDFKAFVYKGQYSGEGTVFDLGAKNAVWGTHSKSMVFSNDAFMVGSFNVDNRSTYYNTELAVFCSGSPELTKDVKDNIQKRMDNSFKLNSEGNGEDCDVHGEVGTFKMLMYYILKIPSHMFQHLL